MALATPADREFKVLPAGFIRDKVVLANFREGLRAQVNPETGEDFTEEEIARATRLGTRWANEAQAIDDYAQGEQRNALYLADQVRLDRATGRWLLDYHGKLWDVSLLAATPGSGPVTVTATAGTIIVGSTTVPDDGAYKARDPAGNLYQVFGTVTADASSNATVTMIALTPGASTNPPAGTVLTWTFRDPSMTATATVAEDFTGGTDQETEAELADRIAAIIQFKPGAGNDSHQRAWARQSSNAVEEGFVYPCALRAGSVVLAITQKRKGALGPNGRIASAATLATAASYLTPPTSPVLPTRTFEIVTTCVPDPVDLTIGLGMQRASKTGWTDAQPFPAAFPAFHPRVSIVFGQKLLNIICPGDPKLPGQASLATVTAPNVPAVMIWNAAKSTWEPLNIASVQDVGGSHFVFSLNTAPSFTVIGGEYVSPATNFASLISGAIVEYFDALGPGDFFDVDVDPRGARCVRFPSNIEQWPTDAGADIVADVLDALGGTTVQGVLGAISKTTPSFQPSFQSGPFMLTPRQVGIYAL